MQTQLDQIKPFIYTNPKGLKLEVLFVLDPAKKGYINATAIAKQFGRAPKDWLKNENVQEYINALIEQIHYRRDNFPSGTNSTRYDDMVVIINGGIPGQNGTWLHPRLAVIFARWLSPHFAVWCDEQIAELFRQHTTCQQQFPELSQIFEHMEEYHQQTRRETEQARQESKKLYIALEERVSRNIETLKQETARQHDATAQMLNRFHSQSLQETKHTLGQIYHGISQVSAMLQQQQQADFLQPGVAETVKQTLLNCQEILQQMLQNYQDQLIQGHLLKIQENLDQIVLQVALPATRSATETPSLVTKIATLRAEGQSWNAIARELNQRGTATASGKGSWYGSSVKKYYTANT